MIIEKRFVKREIDISFSFTIIPMKFCLYVHIHICMYVHALYRGTINLEMRFRYRARTQCKLSSGGVVHFKININRRILNLRLKTGRSLGSQSSHNTLFRPDSHKYRRSVREIVGAELILMVLIYRESGIHPRKQRTTTLRDRTYNVAIVARKFPPAG